MASARAGKVVIIGPRSAGRAAEHRAKFGSLRLPAARGGPASVTATAGRSWVSAPLFRPSPPDPFRNFRLLARQSADVTVKQHVERLAIKNFGTSLFDGFA